MKLYTEMQVFVASFLGSPIAGGFLMAHNARAVGQKGAARKYLWVTILSMIALFAVAMLLPERKLGNYIIPLITAWAMRFWYQKAQGDLFASGRYPNVQKGSWWVALGIALAVVVVLLALLFAVVFLFVDIFG